MHGSKGMTLSSGCFVENHGSQYPKNCIKNLEISEQFLDEIELVPISDYTFLMNILRSKLTNLNRDVNRQGYDPDAVDGFYDTGLLGSSQKSRTQRHLAMSLIFV